MTLRRVFCVVRSTYVDLSLRRPTSSRGIENRPLEMASICPSIGGVCQLVCILAHLRSELPDAGEYSGWRGN
ncbi:unnamed protein product [Protopolystoma xenopodis]|uniref:Uncharacterized protein n=1 Tax=Protopolystoma xenopodis TaxID=117903 RepID=A0A448WFW9_9PLAT|nr:unnamed protein product [Protopolystoma xenopodis]